MRRSPKTKLGRRSQTEVVHEADEDVVALGDEEVSEVDVAEVVAEGSDRMGDSRPEYHWFPSC